MPSNSSPSCSQYQRTASIWEILFSFTISSIFIQNIFGEFNNMFHPIKVWEANRGLPRMYYGITRNPGRWFESIGKTFSTYLSEGSFLSCIVYISFRYVQASSLLHIVVGMFLLPSTSPKLRTLTAYAARAMGAKLSFAFTLVTYKAVNPQFSTFLINTCRS